MKDSLDTDSKDDTVEYRLIKALSLRFREIRLNRVQVHGNS